MTEMKALEADGGYYLVFKDGVPDAGYDFVRAFESYRAVLKHIVKKAPEKVSREEAADMACEFKLLATRALAVEKADGE